MEDLYALAILEPGSSLSCTRDLVPCNNVTKGSGRLTPFKLGHLFNNVIVNGLFK